MVIFNGFFVEMKWNGIRDQNKMHIICYRIEVKKDLK